VTASVYLLSFEPSSGRTLVTLGLVELLAERVGRVGYLRPVGPVPDDDRVGLVRSRLPDPADGHDDVVQLVTAADLADLLAEGRTEELLASAVDAYHDLAGRCDVVVVDGTDHTGVAAAADVDLDATLANDLGVPVVAVVRATGRAASAALDAIAVAHERLEEAGVARAATVVNRVDPAVLDEVLAAHADDAVPVFAVPEDARLAAPTVHEVVRALGATPLAVNRGRATTIAKAPQVDDDRPVTGIRVAAMTIPNLVDRLDEGTLVITPGDRVDVLLAALAADAAPSMPSVAGVVLTGGIEPDPRSLELLQGIASQVPIVQVQTDTYRTADDVSRVSSVIRPHHARKVADALELFTAHVDVDRLASQLAGTRSDRVTPRMFEHRLQERAAADRRTIVLPEGTDERILQAQAVLRRRRVADLVLLGDVEDVHTRASELGVDLDGVEVVDPTSDPRLERYAAAYQRLRAHKGVTLDQARDRLADVSYFGTMMVQLGDADGMVSGAAHTTAHTIRPAFEFVRTRPGVNVVSSVFLMCLADRVLVYGDCAVIPSPTAEELADIAIASAATAATFGIEPRVAMLSYSTGASGTGDDVEKVRAAVELVHANAPDLLVEGPIQYDAAIDAGVAAKKLPDSAVAGRATVFVFPDLDTGNTTYKAVQRSAGAIAIGPVLQGLNKPVNDLSRGCLVADVVNTVAITAIQAQVADAEAAAEEAAS
jgi:phosphate acetyltransferase